MFSVRLSAILLLVAILSWFGPSFVRQKFSQSRYPSTLAVEMASQALKFLTVAPRVKHSATVIFVHVS